MADDIINTALITNQLRTESIRFDISDQSHSMNINIHPIKSTISSKNVVIAIITKVMPVIS